MRTNPLVGPLRDPASIRPSSIANEPNASAQGVPTYRKSRTAQGPPEPVRPEFGNRPRGGKGPTDRACRSLNRASGAVKPAIYGPSSRSGDRAGPNSRGLEHATAIQSEPGPPAGRRDHPAGGVRRVGTGRRPARWYPTSSSSRSRHRPDAWPRPSACSASRSARDEAARLEKAVDSTGGPDAIRTIQQVLDRRCLIGIEINPESRVKAVQGPAAPKLVQNGWSVFLVKVHNEAGVTAPLVAESPNAIPVYRQSTNRPDPKPSVQPGAGRPALDGPGDVQRPAAAEALFRAWAWSTGSSSSTAATPASARRRSASTSARGRRTSASAATSTSSSTLRAGRARWSWASATRTDGRRRPRSSSATSWAGSIPSPGRRLAPDFFFHPQIYRGQRRDVALPPGTVRRRGHPRAGVPRHPPHDRRAPGARPPRDLPAEALDQPGQDGLVLRRPPRPRRRLRHYESPTEGVKPEDMWRHILGEDLDVGCVLTWGPCWYAQKQFFEGKIHPLSTPDYLMRYDVEVSGFPSSHAGHLCLLRLKEDDYPGTTRIEEWPSWDLPVLKWGKSQGGVVGFSHSGWGLKIDDRTLALRRGPARSTASAPTSTSSTSSTTRSTSSRPSTRPRPGSSTSGITRSTAATGRRSAARPISPASTASGSAWAGSTSSSTTASSTSTRWCEGIKQGRSYVSDGKSHLIDFRVDNVAPGESGSELKLDEARHGEGHGPGRRPPRPRPPTAEAGRSDRGRSTRSRTGTSSVRRIGETRKVPVEVVVNGRPVAKTEIAADGNDPGRVVRRADREVELGRACGSIRRPTPTRSSCSSAASRSARRRSRPSGA